MKKMALSIIVAIGLGLTISGCAGLEPKPEAQVNSSIISSYLNENGQSVGGNKCANGNCFGGVETMTNSKSIYKQEREKLLTKIVKTPPTPMRVPDTVLRVLVLPYVDDSGALTAQNYKFVKVDDGKWILGEYLVKEGSAVRMLTPLTTNTIGDEAAPVSEQTTQPSGNQATNNQPNVGQMYPMNQTQRSGGE